jgi:DNA-binding response OmpR family regulator
MVKSESVRILVIEDEVKLATHLSRALESEGHEARVVHDGKVALVVPTSSIEFEVTEINGAGICRGA